MIKEIFSYGFLLKSLILISINLLFADLSSDLQYSRRTAITKAIEEVSNSVVGINVTQLKQKQISPFFDPFWGGFLPYTQTFKVDNMGSGVLVSPDGYIITNAHVIDNALEVIVTVPGGKTYDAEIIGIDNPSDIALVKIDDINLSYAILGDSDDLIVGEWLIALGNPLGLFDISSKPVATVGILSGIGLDFGQKESGKVYQNMLQTDASINPGNSGGPLINVLGEVIGINTFIMTNSNYVNGSIGIGFAIPINTVKTIIQELKKYGKIERNFITGLHVQEIDRMMKKTLKIGNKTGVIITNIDSGSSGEKAGLNIGDIIFSVNQIQISSVADILKVIDEGLHKVGDYITLSILRNNKEMNIELKLESSGQNKVTY